MVAASILLQSVRDIELNKQHGGCGVASPTVGVVSILIMSSFGLVRVH